VWLAGCCRTRDSTELRDAMREARCDARCGWNVEKISETGVVWGARSRAAVPFLGDVTLLSRKEADTCQRGSHHRSGKARRRCPGPRLRPLLCETQGAQHVEGRGRRTLSTGDQGKGGWRVGRKRTSSSLSSSSSLPCNSGLSPAMASSASRGSRPRGSGSGLGPGRAVQKYSTQRVVRGGEARR
jgi:hypothetical protein